MADNLFDRAMAHVRETFPRRRATFRIEFSVDLDPVPGWGNNPEDWRELIEYALTTNAHYNPTAKATLVKVKRTD